MTSPSAAPLTHKGMIEAQRKAFEAGAWFGRQNASECFDRTDNEAKRRYPLTKTVPRVVTETENRYGNGPVSFRCIDGRIEGDDYGWSYKSYNVTAERVRIWADLFANPTEEINADDA